jgi:hypothetical protein
MVGSWRARAIAAALVAIAFFFILSNLVRFESAPTHDSDWVGHYPYVKPTPLPWSPPVALPASTSPVPDRIIAAATIDGDDASRIFNVQPWKTTSCPISRSFAKLHAHGQRVNRGRVASAYLTYIIENYNNLPKVVVFLDIVSNEQKIETAPIYNKEQVIQGLQDSILDKSRFVNLRCLARIGCQSELLPLQMPKNEFKTAEVVMQSAWTEIFQNKTAVPKRLAAPQGADFAVSRQAIMTHSLNDYQRLWEWINKTKMDDDTAGIVLEHVWHVFFGHEPDYCSELSKCD